MHLQVDVRRRCKPTFQLTSPALRRAAAGIGGVHRGGEASMDISADLTELGRTPVSALAVAAPALRKRRMQAALAAAMHPSLALS